METNFKVDVPSFVLGYSAGKKKGGGGTPEGFHMVRFFNDDRTTLLYTVFVPTGASAMYAGETPTSTIDSSMVLAGFEPSPANVVEDMDCFAVYEMMVGTLDETSWETISKLSENGKAQNYFAVGDTKMIHVAGSFGSLSLDKDLGVYIIGFDHNEELEGKGIHFGTFKTAVSNGADVALLDNKYGSLSTDGTKYFNMNHWGAYHAGGWSACDLRYDILGSTDKVPTNYGRAKNSGDTGYDPSDTCTTNPVPNTLMEALPADLRAVMKPMTKYTNNVGYQGSAESKVTATIDYLPLLAEFEIHGVKMYAISHEQYKQKQYDYFAEGRSKVKYYHTNATYAGNWLTRSPHNDSNDYFVEVSQQGATDYKKGSFVALLSPIFKI